MSADRAKRILLSLPYGMSVRNLLRHDVVGILTAEAELLVLTPLHRDSSLRNDLRRHRLEVRGHPDVPLHLKVLLKLAIDAETLAWARTKQVGTFRIIEETLRAGEADDILKGYSGIYSRGSQVALQLPRLRQALTQTLDRAVAMTAPYDRIFEEWRPTLVVSTHGYTSEERILATAARQHGLRSVNVVHSWDNVTTKPKLLERYDHLIVWNEILKQQLVELYDYDPVQIQVTGMPQSDLYVRRDLLEPRDRFLTRLGVPPARRLVTFACPCPEFMPDQHHIVEMLLNAADDGRITQDIALLVRLHPGRETPQIRRLAGNPRLIIDQPSIAFSANRYAAGWQGGGSDVLHFFNLVAHSDVLINGFSTTTIDAAAVDTPVINIAFDGRRDRGYYASVRKHYDWDHYKPIVESGGARIVRSEGELIAAVNAYLSDRTLDAEGRQRIVAEQCTWLDGCSANRIAHQLLALA